MVVQKAKCIHHVYPARGANFFLNNAERFVQHCPKRRGSHAIECFELAVVAI
jgi:hypothetical protein